MDPSELFPRVPLGKWPTSVRLMERASTALGTEVWVKSEESCGAWGGNKVRKLEYILAKVERTSARTLVAYGAGTSSWAAAVALHGTARGYRVRLGLGGAIPEHYRELYRRTNTHVHEFASYNSTPVAAAAAVLGAGTREVVRLPAGGSGMPGDVGSMNAGLEIAEQVRAGALPRPTAIFVPAGTSGTASGIAVGAAIGGLASEVVAVRVTPRPLGTRTFVQHHVRTLARRLNGAGVQVPPTTVRSEGRFFPPAYGASNPASLEAIALAREDDVQLDPTYAAKAFAALIAAARAGERGPVLFVHTSPGPVPDPA